MNELHTVILPVKDTSMDGVLFANWYTGTYLIHGQVVYREKLPSLKSQVTQSPKHGPLSDTGTPAPPTLGHHSA